MRHHPAPEGLSGTSAAAPIRYILLGRPDRVSAPKASDVSARSAYGIEHQDDAIEAGQRRDHSRTANLFRTPTGASITVGTHEARNEAKPRPALRHGRRANCSGPADRTSSMSCCPLARRGETRVDFRGRATSSRLRWPRGDCLGRATSIDHCDAIACAGGGSLVCQPEPDRCGPSSGASPWTRV